jgi:TonB-dependent SusC/RagA subfamily outer membrane receptor
MSGKAIHLRGEAVMYRNLYLAFSLLAVACMPAKAKVAAPPSSPAAAKCSKDDPAAAIFLIDGKPVTCTAAMSLPSSRIASVEVLKGPAAVSLYGPSAAAGVVIIQTKQDR